MNTKKVLVIDDETSRRERLLELGLQEEHTWVENLDEGMDQIHKSQWDEIWLDHDVPGRYLDLRLGTTTIILTSFAESLFHDEIDREDIPHFVIHTMNPVGRANLIAICNRWAFNFTEVHI